MDFKQAIMTSSAEIIEKIKKGQVTFELSKKGLKEPISVMYLYARKPIGKVVLKLEIDQQYFTNPKKFYELHKDKLGYDQKTFYNNYGDYENLHFYHIKNFVILEEPLELSALNKKTAPQSIQYVNLGR